MRAKVNKYGIDDKGIAVLALGAGL